MKTSKKLTALILAVILAVGIAVCNVSAVSKDMATVSAKTGLEPVGSQSINAYLSPTTDELPEKYNSAEEGYVLSVRTQQDNTCWAFGALSTFETLLLVNGEDVAAFAPQHANFWGTKNANGTGWQREYYNGGYSYIPLGYLTSWSGPVYESDFPESSTKVNYDAFSTLPEYVLTEAIFFNSDTDRQAIKELIYTYGSVVGNFNAASAYLSGNTSFYCNNPNFTISQLTGHCVSVVGWDDNYAKENFSASASGTPSEDGAWLIKNSWGTSANSLGGYYWVSYEDVWMFDDVFGPSYAFTNYEKLTDSSKIYQNEVYGATYEFTYLTSKSNPYATITYMNVFDFDADNRNLDKVVFETTSMGADYTVYYIPVDGSAPTEQTNLWTELYSGTIDYTGYICVDIEDTLLPEGKGAIGISINNKQTYLENKDKEGYTYIHNSIGIDEWLFSNKKYIFYPESEYGMSYYMKNGTVRDVMDYYSDELSDDIGGTFVIKAITKNAEITTDPTEPAETTSPLDSTDPTEPDTSKDATETTAPASSTDPTESTSTLPSETGVTDNTEPEQSQSTSPSESRTSPSAGDDFTEPFAYLLGDADLSGTVNVKDATVIQKHAASLLTLSEKEQMAADSNSNGVINVVDATIIQKFVASIEIQYKVGELVIYFE